MCVLTFLTGNLYCMYSMFKHDVHGSFVVFCEVACQRKWVEYVKGTGEAHEYTQVLQAVFGPWCAHCSYCGELLKRTQRKCIQHDECPTQANEFSIWPVLFVRKYFEAYMATSVSSFKLDKLLFLMDGEGVSPRVLFDALCD